MGHSFFRFNISVMLMLSISWGISWSQNSLKSKLFEDYTKIIDDLGTKNAEILSPGFFRKALENYSAADREYDQNKKGGLKEIRGKLDESKRYAELALRIIDLSNLYLKNTIEARSAAFASQAPLYSPKIWEKAEKEMQEAGYNFEDDDIDDAREHGTTALKLYKEAELLAIKNGILGEARKEIQLAEEAEAQKYSYRTLIDAKNLLLQTEQLIESNPYDKTSALQKAQKASYQARHSAYLARTIKELSKNSENWEILILKFEDILSNIGSALDFKAEYDQGFDKSVKTIQAILTELQTKNKELAEKNRQLEEELNIIKESDATKTAQLEKTRIFEEKLAKIKALFTEQEAKVIYESENLIIRLYGLNFPSGQAVIQPEYFSLLTKVQKAIKEFPDKYIVIEGHTDAMGNPETNKFLSEKRAEAVKEYLLANMDLRTQQISHYGLGDQRPIASNRTMEGREKNRRIDVIISLQEE